LIYTIKNSLHHALSLLSLLYFYRLSPGNGSQCHRFIDFGIHILSGRQLPHNFSWQQFVATEFYPRLASTGYRWLVPTEDCLLADCLRTRLLTTLQSKSKSHYDRRSVGQSTLVSRCQDQIFETVRQLRFCRGDGSVIYRGQNQ
jgi:hypothetical protein